MEHIEVHTGDKPFLCEECDNSITTPESGMKVQVIVDTGAKLVQCDMCGKKFTRASNLTGHIVVHKTEKPYQCDRCRQYFESPATLKTHMDIHLNENRFECETCNKTFSSHGNLMKHKRLHETTKPFPCEICKKSYASESYLKSHMWEHVSEKPFECDVCKKRFPLLLHLKRHMAVHVEIKPHDCDICGKTFQSPGNLKRHKQTHILYECQVCGKRYAKLDHLKDHLTDHIEHKPFSCEICDRRFVNEVLLQAHQWVHTRDKKPYFCTICKSKFALSKELKEHKAEVHGENPKPRAKKTKVNVTRNDESVTVDNAKDPPVSEDEYSVPKVEEEEEIRYVYDPNQRYPCEICGKTFKTLRIRAQHIRLHDGEKSFQCDICGSAFRTQTNLRRHAKLHNRDNPFQCTVCDKSYKTIGALKTHMWEHNDIKPFECEICHKKFSQEMHVKRHMIVHSENKKYKCDLCDMTFNQSGNLKRHRITHSAKLRYKCPICEKMFRTSAEMKEHLEEHNTTKRYQCKFCHRRYASEAILKGHMWAHAEKRFFCKKCNKRFASRVFLRRHMTVHAQLEKDSAYQCNICHKRFLKLGNYQTHVTLHGTLSKLNCSLCNVSFSNNRYLDKHMKENHPDSKMFGCDFCEEKFLTTYSRSRHIQTQHAEESKSLYKCDKCDKVFPTQDAMTAHQVDHGIENPFKCGVCDKSFVNKLRLQLHMRIHRDVFNCRFCKMVFSSFEEKRDHVKAMTDDAHKPFHCQTCSKTFHSKQRLERHTLTHTGERPFACSVCEKRFTQSAHLKDHMRLHTGERPFFCKMCNRSFSHARTLKCHLEVCQGADKDCPCGCGKNNKPHKAFQCDMCGKRFQYEKNFKIHTQNGSCANKKCPCGCMGNAEKHRVLEKTDSAEDSSKARLLLHNIEMAEDVEPVTKKESSNHESVCGDSSVEGVDLESKQTTEQTKSTATVESVNMENTFKLVETILEAAAGRSSVYKSEQPPKSESAQQEGLHKIQDVTSKMDTTTMDSNSENIMPIIKTEPIDHDDISEGSGKKDALLTDSSCQTNYTDVSPQNNRVSKKACQTDTSSSPGYHIVYVGPESIHSKTSNNASSRVKTDVTEVVEATNFDLHPEQIEATSSVAQLIEAATISEGICMTQDSQAKQEVGISSAQGTDTMLATMGYQIHGAEDQIVSVISGHDYEANSQSDAFTVVTDGSSGLSEALVLDSIPADAVRIIATRPDNDTDTIIIKIEYDDNV